MGVGEVRVKEGDGEDGVGRRESARVRIRRKLRAATQVCVFIEIRTTVRVTRIETRNDANAQACTRLGATCIMTRTVLGSHCWGGRREGREIRLL